MRVLHVIQQLQTGGAERVVLSLVRETAAEGVTSAIAAEPGDLAAAVPVTHPLRRVERRVSAVPGAVKDVRRARAAFGPDLCHAHNPTMALVTSLATRRGRRPAALVTIHGVPDDSYALSARMLRWSGLPVVSCGPGVDAALREHGLVPRAMIHNGIGAAAIGVDVAAVRSSCGVGEGVRLVVCVGRLAPVKNQQLAIRALDLLDPDVCLLLVGDGSERSQLEQLAASLGLQDRVLFTGGRADAPAISAAADVVISTSTSEGLPLALCEAMAAGRPVVATGVRGNRELISDERTGLLVDVDDPTALAVSIRRMLDDPPLAQRLAAAGQQSVADLTEAHMAAEYLALYRSLA